MISKHIYFSYLLLLILGSTIKSFIFGVRNDEAPSKEDVVVFSIKQLNLQLVHQKLMMISDPQSAEYGHFWTKTDLKSLTSNSVGSIKVKEYFRSKGVKIVHETIHGEYLVAMASTAIWESLLQTAFYEYNHNSKEMHPTHSNNFTLDKNISSYVSAIFRVYRTPPYNSQMYGRLLNHSLNIETDDSLERKSLVFTWTNDPCKNTPR